MTFFAQFTSFPEIIRQALRLNPQVFAEIQNDSHGIYIAWAIVVLAALSESLGQSMVLFLNRVQPRRFVATLVITTLSNVVGYFLWTVTVWLIVHYVFALQIPLWIVANAVGLAYAPQLLAFFELTPFIGNLFGLLLTLWSLVAIIVAIHAGLGLATWQATLASALGWLLIQAWRRSLGRPLYRLGRWLERRAAGVPMDVTMQNMTKVRRQPTLQNWQQWLQKRSRVIDTHIGHLRQGNPTLPKDSTPESATKQER